MLVLLSRAKAHRWSPSCPKREWNLKCHPVVIWGRVNPSSRESTPPWSHVPLTPAAGREGGITEFQ